MSEASTFVKRLLKEGEFAYFCTTDARNNPHLAPVFFLFDLDGCHANFLFSRNSKKVRNLQTRSNVSFTVDVRDHINPFQNKGVMIQGKASVKESNDAEADMTRVKELFEEKYGWSPSGSFFRHDDDKCLVDVAVNKISCWQGPKFISCPKFCVTPSQRRCACISTL